METENPYDRDRRCCGVIAVCLMFNETFDDALERFGEFGRADNRRTSSDVLYEVIRSYGYAMVKLMRKGDDLLDDYLGLIRVRGGYRGKRLLTSHPSRYPDIPWSSTMQLWYISNHVSVMIDGKIEDWTYDRAFRVRRIVGVVPWNEVSQSCTSM